MALLLASHVCGLVAGGSVENAPKSSQRDFLSWSRVRGDHWEFSLGIEDTLSDDLNA